MRDKYKKSEEYLARALKSVPLGSQTFSKSKTQLPYGVSPYFASEAMGAYLWDIDGNKYVDFLNGLAAITLGYVDPEVTNAVEKQLKKGTIFSLAHQLEFEVAEKICEMVPCAEKVRFGKNGSDATSGAIRLARAYTGKDHVFVCGYHGWQDWYIGSTSKYLGVPEATRNLTHTFDYNNINGLADLFNAYRNQVAAVIMEPVNATPPNEGFLEQVKEITHHNDAVLIFDETVSGFRFSKGGAQEYFNVTPDVATFGKGLANGYPVSAVAGKRDLMELMEEIFFSFTFGGETLSLAAASATLDKLQREPVIDTLFERGQYLQDNLTKLISTYEVDHIFKPIGYPVKSVLKIEDCAPFTMWDMKTLLIQEMFANGCIMIGPQIISYAHKNEDIDHLLSAYQVFFRKVRQALNQGSMRGILNTDTLEPLFKVR